MLETRIKTELTTALREKNEPLKSTLRMVISDSQKFMTAPKYHKGPLTEEDWMNIITFYVKQLKKSLVEFEKVNSTENINGINFEIQYWNTYLPTFLSEQETEILVKQTQEKYSLTNSGKLIGMVLKENKGKVDNSLVKTIVDRLLK